RRGVPGGYEGVERHPDVILRRADADRVSRRPGFWFRHGGGRDVIGGGSGGGFLGISRRGPALPPLQLFGPPLSLLGDLPVIIDGLLEGLVGLLKLSANLFHFVLIGLSLGRTHGQAKDQTCSKRTKRFHFRFLQSAPAHRASARVYNRGTTSAGRRQTW